MGGGGAGGQDERGECSTATRSGSVLPPLASLESLLLGLVGNMAAATEGITDDLVGRFWCVFQKMDKEKREGGAKLLRLFLGKKQYVAARGFMAEAVGLKAPAL